MLHVLAHPLRLQILRALEHGRVASPSEIADDLGQSLNDVSYHVKTLEKEGCLEFMGRRATGSAPLKSYYRRTVAHWFNDEAWNGLPPEIRESISATILADITKELHASLLSGRFDARPDRHLSRSPLTLDQDGWTELNDASDELLMRAHDIEAGSLERLAQAGGGSPQSGMLNITFFEPAPTPAEDE